jgi:uncharacterized protein YndB with AHSA1/START domain
MTRQPIAEQDSVVVEIQIAAPPERVFQALIDENQLMQWFTDVSHAAELWQMDARVGSLWRFATKEGKAGVNGVTRFQAHGEILELDRPRLLAYTWIANWHDHPDSVTTARWELTPPAGGTHVRVIHGGLAEQPVARKDYSGGWIGVLANLKKFTES